MKNLTALLFQKFSLIFLLLSSVIIFSFFIFSHIFDDQNNIHTLADNPYKATIDTMVSIRFSNKYLETSPKFQVLKFKSHPLIQHKLKYQILTTPNSSKWVYYVPGIFTYLDSPFAAFFSKKLSSQGYNVLMTPNTFTSDFLKSRPTFKPGLIRQEAKLFCSLIKDFKSKHKINIKMDVIGISYGGLLSTAITAQCPNQFKKLTLISPPVHLAQSMKKIFTFITAARKRDPRVTSTPEWWMFLKTKAGLENNYENLLSRFFLDGLYYTLYIYNRIIESDNHSFYKKLVFGSKKYRTWQKEQDVTSFYTSHLSDEKTNLSQFGIFHWLSQLKNINFPFHTYSSLDDPINTPEQWQHLTEKLGPSYFTLLPKGGHLGVVNTPWFDRFIVHQMEEQQ